MEAPLGIRRPALPSWTYNWWPQAPGTFKILSRATDDSLNLEVPGAGVSLTVIPGATLSLV